MICLQFSKSRQEKYKLKIGSKFQKSFDVAIHNKYIRIKALYSIRDIELLIEIRTVIYTVTLKVKILFAEYNTITSCVVIFF